MALKMLCSNECEGSSPSHRTIKKEKIMEYMVYWNVINSLFIIYGLEAIHKNNLSQCEELKVLENKVKKASPRMRK